MFAYKSFICVSCMCYVCLCMFVCICWKPLLSSMALAALSTNGYMLLLLSRGPLLRGSLNKSHEKTGELSN